MKTTTLPARSPEAGETAVSGESGQPVMLTNDDDTLTAVETVREICKDAGQSTQFRTAVVLGSGLGAFADQAIQRGGIAIDYHRIAGLPQPAVAGHAGRLVIGAGPLQGVLLFQGRVHFYEGHALKAITFAVRMAAELGIRNLVVTNAAGGIRSEFRPGDLMLIDGHWTLLNVQSTAASVTFQHQHRNLWNARLRQQALSVPTSLHVHSGVYAMMSGPNYETPAEVWMLASLGVSAVGMSTIPEAIAAASRGVRTLGVSCITNVASGLSDVPLNHTEVSETAASVEHEFTDWMQRLLISIE